ncbi:MAG: DNA primase family protein [Promethearchaeota archaeon]
MVNNFIEKLIEKRNKTEIIKLKDAEEFTRDMFKKHEEQKKFGNIIQSFTDKLHLAEQFYKINPFYYDKVGVWWVWKGNYCSEEPENVVSIKKGGGLKNYYEVWDDIDILNAITYSSPANTINSKERQEILQSLKQIGRKHKPKDVPKNLIQFLDEVVDIKTGDKYKASADYFFTNPIPHKLGISEETPKIDKLFREWVGEDYIDTLYEIISYCLYKDYPIERIFCLLGGGANGKSCFLKVLRNFIGSENIISTDLDLLIHSRFETAKLRNKMACMIGETNFEDLTNTSRIKRMTSGKDPIPIEYKNKGSMDYINYAKLIMATNNLPPTTDKTAGFGRRWCIIDFPNQFNTEHDILSEIPEEEYENLGLKCITFLIDLLKKRSFKKEGSIEERIKKYEEKSNPFDKFWKENIIIDSTDSHIWKHEFRDFLNDWLKEHKFRTMSDSTISKLMKEKEILTQKISADFIDDTGKRPRWNAWIGIKLITKSENVVKDVQDVNPT